MSASTLERWRRIESILDGALDLPREMRARYVDRCCPPGDELREDVEQLLHACDRSEHFMERPLAGEAAPFVALSLAEADLPARGERVGAYRIVGEAGRGGMGVVYLAERDDGAFRMRVALKLVRRGKDAGDLLTRRFHEERQILASLDHPGIARLIDGGALADGRPYLVMEYVEGTPIDQFCDERQLDVTARLELFCKVCDAVHHAHRHHVVHQDLKPTNILVTSDATVKLLDFGIATLLTPDDRRDTSGSDVRAPFPTRILTPDYASPEQRRGDSASTASDVYSLGVILYQLLAGRLPRRRASPAPVDVDVDEIDDAPERPSDAAVRDRAELTTFGAERTAAQRAAARSATPQALRRQLTGVLDDIVLTALRIEPRDRHASVGAFALAVRGQLIVLTRARNDDWPARASALVRRRAPVMIAAAVAGVTLIAAVLLVRAPSPASIPSPSSIVVMPFTPSVRDTLLQRLGRDLVSTLSANLDGIGMIRVVDPQTVLEEVNHRSPAMSQTEVTAIARRLGGGILIRGTLARVGMRVRVDAMLVSTGDAEPATHVSATAAPADLAALTDSLTWTLLRPLLQGPRVPPLASGMPDTHSLTALRGYLDGERLLNEYRMRAAADAFTRAIAADSTFWLARFHRAWVRDFFVTSADGARDDSYVAHRAELPTPDRLLVEARLATGLEERRLLLESLLVRYPAYWLGWFELGELHVQRLPFAGSPLAASEELLRRAAWLNPQFVLAWDRLFWVAIAARDTNGSARALEALTRLRYDSTSQLDDRFDMMKLYRHLDHLARFGGVPDATLADGLARALDNAGFRPSGNGMPDRLQGGIVRYGFHHARMNLAEQQIRSGVTPPYFHWQVIANGWASRGAWDAALVASERAASVNAGPDAGLIGYRLAALGVWLSGLEPTAAAGWRIRAHGASNRMSPEERAELAWVDGLVADARRDAVGLARARAALRETRSDDAALLDSSLAAFARELAGDQPGALALLQALERDRYRISNEHPYLTGVNRLVASRLLAAAGDPAGAARLLTWHEAMGYRAPQAVHANALFAPFADLERAPILETLGQRDAARAHYERFLESYDAPVPAHRRLVDNARAAVARLSRH